VIKGDKHGQLTNGTTQKTSSVENIHFPSTSLKMTALLSYNLHAM
jgi:hypothetical protein